MLSPVVGPVSPVTRVRAVIGSACPPVYLWVPFNLRFQGDTKSVEPLGSKLSFENQKIYANQSGVY